MGERTWDVLLRHPALNVLAAGAALIGLGCGGGDVTAPTSGSVEITTVTSGPQPDPDGYALTMDGGSETAIGPNATLQRDGLDPGPYSVRLTGMATNCTVAGENPRTITVAAGDTALVAFSITCTATTGSLEITTTTTGSLLDADGYSASVDGGTAESIGINATLTVGNLVAGPHSVDLSGLAPNCQVAGDNPRAITVPAGATVTASFTIACHLTQGTKIAFESSRDGSADVFVMNTDGSDQKNLTSNPAVDNLGAWSPDGTKLVFTSDRDRPFSTDVFVMNADGSGQTNLTRHVDDDGSPVWSPDGQKIAFETNRDGHYQIYVMNADGSGLTRLTNTLTEDDNVPTWSPDGRWILFVREGRSFRVNSDGTGLAALTSPTRRVLDGAGRWSPDGTKIAFTRLEFSDDEFDPYEVTNLWIMNADGSGLMSLTDYSVSSGSSVHGWSWKPDGTELVFGSRTAEGDDIRVIRPDGTGLTNLTSSHNVGASPTWSPAGTRILLSGLVGDVGPDVFVMDSDGSHLTNLTNNPAWDGQAIWQP